MVTRIVDRFTQTAAGKSTLVEQSKQARSDSVHHPGALLPPQSYTGRRTLSLAQLPQRVGFLG